MRLDEFTEPNFDQLIQWINSEELNYLWGGPNYTFPLTHQKIRQHCSKQDVFPFLCTLKGQNVGFVELIKKTEHHFRICRVFIAHQYRGQGLSAKMLNQLIEKARTEFNATHLSLAVFEHNKAAKHCYESLGFKTVSIEKGTRSFRGKNWDLVLMDKALTQKTSKENALKET